MTAKKKKRGTKIKRPPGRPRKNYSFEDAVYRVRQENLQSVRDYAKWYAFNMPAKLPKRPDRAYKSEWKGWGYFLGNYNEMFGEKIKYRSYEDSKAYARKLGFTSVTQWHEFCREGNRPIDIPARPDVHYQRTKEWYTWTDFLGTRINHRIEYAQNSKKYFYIGRYDDAPFHNIFVFGVDTSLYNLSTDNEFSLMKVYDYEDDFDWISTVERNGVRFHDNGRSNEYFIDNPGNLINEISLNLDEVLDINDHQ